MNSVPKLLLLSGSARRDALNTQLVQLAGRKAAAAGADVQFLDLASLDLPVLNADLMSAGLPAGALRLREVLADVDGVLLSSPEYNALPTPLFINAMDWLSVVQADGALPSGTGATAGKPVGLLAASPGALGGIRALPIVRTFLSTNFAMVVVPEQLALPAADKAFDGQGELVAPALAAVLDKLVASVIRQARWRQER